MRQFEDRKDAGHVLAQQLSKYAGTQDLLVLALPRGGVPVAAEVAQALDAPLDLYLVRKLGLPGQEELAMGAIASGGTLVLNRDVVERAQVPRRIIDTVAQREQRELERRERAYRGNRPPVNVTGKTVIVVDDGLATGSTMQAALAALRNQEPGRLVAAVPVGSPETCHALRRAADEVVCAVTPDPFYAVGLWYQDFSQTTDQEVQAILSHTRSQAATTTTDEPRG